MVIDCLALSLEISPDQPKTEQILNKELSGNRYLFNSIKQRQSKDYLPMLQIDGTIEFKPSGGIADVITLSPKKPQPQHDETRFMQMRH